MVQIDNHDFLFSHGPATKRVSPLDWDAQQHIVNNWFKVSMKIPNNDSDLWDWVNYQIEEYYVYLVTNEIIFSNEIDAVAFKLRWI